jgi:transposase InsO family protein
MGGLLREGKQVRFRFIEAQKAEHSVTALCRNVQVRRSGYYAWSKRPPSRHATVDQAANVHIRAIFRHHRRRYGSPRILRELRRQGFRFGRRRVARLMSEGGLRAKGARRFRATTDSRHGQAAPDNLLCRRFTWPQANQAWLTDITYLPTTEGFAYLSCMLDLHSRRIIAWEVSESLDASSSCRVLQSAIDQRQPPPGLIHHSDRGIQYVCMAYQRILGRHAVVCSMSRKGNCWDNSPMESFFATLKREVDASVWVTRSAAAHAVAEFIRYYNEDRAHSALGYLSPAQYERTQQPGESTRPRE